MKYLLSLLLLLLISARQSVSQLSSAQRQLLLDLHNQARSEVSPTATNMEEMVNDNHACIPRVTSETCITIYRDRVNVHAWPLQEEGAWTSAGHTQLNQLKPA